MVQSMTNIKRWRRTISLHILITSQLIIQVLGIVGVVGYMSYRSGRESVQFLAERLMTEVGKRVNLYVAQELWLATQINRMNVEQVESGEVHLDDFAAVDRLLWRRMKLFKAVTTIMLGQADGTFRYIGAPDTSAEGQRRAGFSDPDRPERLYVTLLDDTGNCTELMRVLDPFHVQERPWYQAAQKTQEPGWTEPFQVGKQPLLTVSAYTPFYDDDRLLGVFAVNLSFAHLQTFLENLDICEACRVVLVDEGGELIADSAGGALFQLTDHPDEGGLYWGNFNRLKPSESDDPVIAAAAKRWQQLLTSATVNSNVSSQDLSASIPPSQNTRSQILHFQIPTPSVSQPHHAQFYRTQEQYWLQLISLNPLEQSDSYPQWTIAVIVPQTEFMAEITANIRRTVIFCLVALSGAIASGILTSHRLTRSLSQLTQATHALANEDFNQPLPSSRIWEVNSLSTSFRQMLKSLQQAVTIRHNYQRQLEQQIAEKTASLQTELQQRTHIEEQLRQVNQELKKHAQTDSLTQIANRRQFTAVLESEWQRLQELQAPLSIILFDVDYFKRYNDHYGHPMGDKCLFRLAQASQHCLRSRDLIARYGGEEFIVLLPDTDRKGAIEVAQRIQASIQSLNMPHATSEVNSVVTVSMGIAYTIPQAQDISNPQPSPSLANQLISQADQALYHSKMLGRNQFSVYGGGGDNTIHTFKSC